MMSRKLIDRRQVLAFCGTILVAASAGAQVIFGGRPFARQKTQPPSPVDQKEKWKFFSVPEAIAVEAVVDRLIPSDALGIGGREAGCAVFIDRQLAGDYGRSSVWYLDGPFQTGTPQQGPQYTSTIATRYQRGLAALDLYCVNNKGRSFAELDQATQDHLLKGLEEGSVELDGTSGKDFFKQLLKNTREGYFADPLYGANKDMAGWRMIGFPGARYDYRDEIAKRGEALELTPVSIYGTHQKGKA